MTKDSVSDSRRAVESHTGVRDKLACVQGIAQRLGIGLDEVAFMGDDWAFATREGTMLGYAKPMFIKPHHKAIYPHLFQGLQKPLIPSSISRPVATT